MQGRLGYFLDDDAADEFGAPTVLVELGELVILRDGDGRDAGTHLGDFEQQGCGAHADEGYAELPTASSAEVRQTGSQVCKGSELTIDTRHGRRTGPPVRVAIFGNGGKAAVRD